MYAPTALLSKLRSSHLLGGGWSRDMPETADVACGFAAWRCYDAVAQHQFWAVGPDLIEQFIFSRGSVYDH